MYIKFKIIVYRAKIQKKCAEYKKLAVSFNKIRYAQECTKKNTQFFFVIPFACSIFVLKSATIIQYTIKGRFMSR